MQASELVWGRLCDARPDCPLNLSARLCDLRPRFLAKGEAGRGFRAISRNGRILLASDSPLEELTGSTARVRIQIWHKALLSGEKAEPYGLLLSVRTEASTLPEPDYRCRLANSCGPSCELAIAVGGLQVLEFSTFENQEEKPVDVQ